MSLLEERRGIHSCISHNYKFPESFVPKYEVELEISAYISVFY